LHLENIYSAGCFPGSDKINALIKMTDIE